MKGTKNLTQGPILKQLFTLAMPIMATSFIQMAYSLTDMAWVGRIGSEAIAAVGSVGILTWMSTSISLLNKVGSEVSVGQSIGAQNEQAARAFASHNLTLSLLRTSYSQDGCGISTDYSNRLSIRLFISYLYRDIQCRRTKQNTFFH